MIITLPPLPYAKNALEPYISERTVHFHYDKHHKTYVENLKGLIQATVFEDKAVEYIIKETAGKADQVAIFNNAAQVWNHTFYWSCLSPKGGGAPKGELGEKINQDFGSFEDFAALFKKAALSQFGSGWAWLVVDSQGKLQVTKTPNADLPLVHGQKALLTCDVWEHAYYLDYQNRRADYVDIFLNHLVNWDFAQENLNKD